ncbi:MAG: hypothetical protein KAS72_00835 [Phycisphaerales bacterium]|nr:hypothetical protein [Phycisphaerales bacterium]
MTDLVCAPFLDLIDRMRLEHRTQRSIFDLPRRKWYAPACDADDPDLSVTSHGKRAGTPVGPAAGPHTQMAQNLILGYLAGARIFELKTVQINDQLTIPRPCIDAANVCYNVEWSQELRIADSLSQYVQAAMLIHMLRAAPQVFDSPFGDLDMADPIGDVVFDMSVGYDLAGIQLDVMRRFMAGMADARDTIDRLRTLIPDRLAALRDLDYPAHISTSVTLSTFHGCPPDEIERICEFLLTDMNVDVVVKMNPPMLGQDELEHLLHDVLGYEQITVNPEAYATGLRFDEAVELCSRVTTLASSRGRSFGVKFCNTLEVLNHCDVFGADCRVMYLSGPPLHVIALALADRFRRAIGHELPMSFSAGVDRRNFCDTVACGFLPVTVCTDLLKPGGYGRLPAYLHALRDAMTALGASTLDQYILDAHGQREAANGDPTTAAALNLSIITKETRNDERYHARRNNKAPQRVDSHLTIFDCITCEKCIPACPNDANFIYETPRVDLTYRDVEVRPDGSIAQVGDEKHFHIEQRKQIANFADFCNECGNCDTFCPEHGGPFMQKPNFFGSRASLDASPRDGFLLDTADGSPTLIARIDGNTYQFDGIRYSDDIVTVIVENDRFTRLSPGATAPSAPHRIDMERYHTMATLLRRITDPSRIHQVNTRLHAAHV